jgi:hypothetical protein
MSDLTIRDLGKPLVAPYSVVEKYSVVEQNPVAAQFGRMLMLAGKQEDRSRRITVGADKTYDAKDFVVVARALNVTPHITKNEKGRRSNIDGGRPGTPVTASA